MRTLALVAVFAVLACEPLPEATPRSTPPATPPIVSTSTTSQTPHATSPATTPSAISVPVAGGPPSAPSGTVQIAVVTAKGVDPSLVGKVYGQAAEALGHCRQPGGGTVHVSVVQEGRSLRMHIEPGATLNPLAHDCVLEALSTIDVPETAANRGGAATPPSGFTSLLTLSW